MKRKKIGSCLTLSWVGLSVVHLVSISSEWTRGWQEVKEGRARFRTVRSSLACFWLPIPLDVLNKVTQPMWHRTSFSCSCHSCERAGIFLRCPNLDRKKVRALKKAIAITPDRKAGVTVNQMSKLIYKELFVSARLDPQTWGQGGYTGCITSRPTFFDGLISGHIPRSYQSGW